MTQSKDLQQLIIEGIHERKGRGVTVVDLSSIESAAASRFIIAEGNSATQTAAIAESVAEYVLKNSGVKPYAIDGDTKLYFVDKDGEEGVMGTIAEFDAIEGKANVIVIVDTDKKTATEVIIETSNKKDILS